MLNKKVTKHTSVLIIGNYNLADPSLFKFEEIEEIKIYNLQLTIQIFPSKDYSFSSPANLEEFKSNTSNYLSIIDCLDYESNLSILSSTIMEFEKLRPHLNSETQILYKRVPVKENTPSLDPANYLCKELLNCFRNKHGFHDETENHLKNLMLKNSHSNARVSHNQSYSVSAIIACYKDAKAIPIMHQRLKTVFSKLNIDHEIIFVNDCSPDESEAIIRELSSKDPNIIGISHSRNFGSQSAFKSGMAIASKDACVLMDGDLQDPPELIESFVTKWKEGYEVVYGRRVKREATWFMQFAYKAFYRVFDYFSYIPIPKDAGDFSLITRRVVHQILAFPERDAFLRGIRAFVGFKQTGVDYVRPERMFGVTTNNLFKNIEWAKKGIFSFSNKPLTFLSFLGFILFPLSLFIAMVQVLFKIFFPNLAPAGFTSTITIIVFFGAVNLFGIGVIAEYLAKIFEEVKQRPSYIRSRIIKNGDIVIIE